MRHLEPTTLPAPLTGRRIYSDDTLEVLLELRGAAPGRLMVVVHRPTDESLDQALEERLRKVAQRAATSLNAAGLQLGPQTMRLHVLNDGRRVLIAQPERTASGVHEITIDDELAETRVRTAG